MADLIAAFQQETECLGVDPEFRRWGGIVLASALLSRDNWTSITAGMPLYGNLYVAFVGESGFGKSLVINAVTEALLNHSYNSNAPAARIVLVPQDCTLEELVLQLIEHFPEADLGDHATHSVAMLADEIGVLFREDANRKDLSLLQSIYDMRSTIGRRRVRDRERQLTPQGYNHYFTALWGMTPAWLETGLPTSNIGLGWPARTHFVMGHQTREIELFGESLDLGEKLRTRLKRQMEDIIGAARGRWIWDREASDAIQRWLDQGLPGFSPQSELLNGYANRRLEHSAKLSFIYAVARHPMRPHIEIEDFRAARDAMAGVERDLPSLFERVGASPTRHGEQRLIDWAALRGDWFKEQELRAATREFFSPNEHNAAVNALIGAGVFQLKELVSYPNRVLRLRGV